MVPHWNEGRLAISSIQHKFKLSFNSRLSTEENGKKTQVDIYSDEKISSLIDYSMNSMDKNNDGFITFSEFIRVGKKE